MNPIFTRLRSKSIFGSMSNAEILEYSSKNIVIDPLRAFAQKMDPLLHGSAPAFDQPILLWNRYMMEQMVKVKDGVGSDTLQ